MFSLRNMKVISELSSIPPLIWSSDKEKILPKLYRFAGSSETIFLTHTGIIYSASVDVWMTCDFTSLSTVFQSYQDDERLIMKSCVQWNPV